MIVSHLFDPDTFTLTYVVMDPVSKDGIVIDPVLDFDPASGQVQTRSLQKLCQLLADMGVRLQMILETHAHADHLSAATVLKEQYPGVPIGIGEKICVVQETFKNIFNLAASFAVDGSQFDHLLRDGEAVAAGTLRFRAIATPGHTPACMSYVFGDAVFTGDALFMPDYGTGRCDFPAGCADDLYQSVHDKLYHLPDATLVYTGHDYQPGGRELVVCSTIGEEKRSNIQLRAQTTRQEFVTMRQQRDAGLAAPRLLLPSIQVNINAGRLPEPEENGTSYLKLPLRL